MADTNRIDGDVDFGVDDFLDGDIPAEFDAAAHGVDQGAEDGQSNMLALLDSTIGDGDVAEPVVDSPAAGPAVDTGEVEVPSFESKTTLDYAMHSTDFDQRPAHALARAMRGQAAVSRQVAESATLIEQARGDFEKVQGFATQGRTELEAWVFGDGGLVARLKAIFETERGLNREAAKGGLLDAAEEVERLVERYGNAKRAEFDSHAIAKQAELDREMHRITLSSLQNALQAIVDEKTALATQKAEYEARSRYSRRMGLAYGIAGLCAGLALGLVTVLMR